MNPWLELVAAVAFNVALLWLLWTDFEDGYETEQHELVLDELWGDD